MENEENPLVLELSRFQELFKAHLRQPSSSESLIMEMQSSLDKSMSLARTIVPAAEQPTSPSEVGARLMTKKRKKMTKSTIGQRVVMQMDMGDGVGDRHSWRKYGQKSIQYAKYPRCYYRCTYSGTRNCPAKKQVQQSDENPSAFEVTYIQTHTCYPSEIHNYPAEKQVQQSDEKPSTFRQDTYIQTHTCYPSEAHNCSAEKQVQQPDENPSIFGDTYIQTHTCHPNPRQQCRNINIEVSSSDLASPPLLKQVQLPDENPSTFGDTYIQTHTCYPNPQQQCLNINTEVSSSDLASPSILFPTTPEICFDSSTLDNSFMGNFSASPISAEMPGSNYFSVVSEWDMREGPSIQAKGSNSDNSWEENSAAISPFLGMDMDSMLNPAELDPCFQIS